ncbi:hypothetical protein GIB67_001839 [Kingdonia uniflora]|uniref:Mitochondrial carrier protein n=1 Tax=Kingdonia uniflora TaxID=39325 RepID=A0A7J7LBY2_9MAGN|nr:hypothetical protein GIB67_001839 [Kingdonia uniflora]
MMDQFMDVDPVRGGFTAPVSAARRGWDVKESEDVLHFRIDMPGLGKENVKASVKENTLIIKGEVDEIKAEMKNGVLKVFVPKLSSMYGTTSIGGGGGRHIHVALDKTKFYVVGAGLFTGITVALYPVSVVKTRLQVTTKDSVEKNVFSIARGLLKKEGVPGLYRGFGTVITGAVPTRIIFLTSLETTKVAAFRMIENFNFSEPAQAAIANGLAGMTSSLISQAVFVPIDVVSQKLMVQGYSGHAKYNGGLDVVRAVLKSNGIRGLYRGFGLSAMTYSPSSAVWWATYGSSQRLIWSFLGYGNEHNEPVSSESTVVLVQASGGIAAGAVASCVTTPLDTIKTRLQVSGLEKRETARQVVKKLIVEDGWKGLYRGLGPRFFSMSAWGTSMIVGYEYLKRLCAKDDPVLS